MKQKKKSYGIYNEYTKKTKQIGQQKLELFSFTYVREFHF